MPLCDSQKTSYDIAQCKISSLPVLQHPELSDIGQGLHERDSVSLSGASPTGCCMPETNNQYTVIETVICHKATVMILSFRTDRSGQTVQTQIRLLLEDQSDQGLHCLLLHLHLFDEIL